MKTTPPTGATDSTNPPDTTVSTGPDDDREEKTATGESAVPAAVTDTVGVPAEPDAEPDDSDPSGGADAEDGPEDEPEDESGLESDPYAEAEAAASAGVGTAAAAVVATGLGIVSLTGAWTGRVAAERETLIGQMNTAEGASVAQQVSEIYGDAWHTTALVNGLFALVALLVGVFVLVRPAFGAPSLHPQAGWVRAVATAGIALGVLGVLISVGMYVDLFVSLPTAGTP